MTDVTEHDRRHTKKKGAAHDRPTKYETTEYREISWPAVQRALLPPLSVIFLLIAVADVVMLSQAGGTPSAVPVGAGVWIIAALLCWGLLALGRVERTLKRQSAPPRTLYLITRRRRDGPSVEGIFSDPESARQWVDAQPTGEEDRYSVDQIELDDPAQSTSPR
jgi:DNA-binding transcriptional LysR family regulator